MEDLYKLIKDYISLNEKILRGYSALDSIVEYQKSILGKNPVYFKEMENKKRELRESISVYKQEKERVKKEIDRVVKARKNRMSNVFLLLLLASLFFFILINRKTGLLILEKSISPLAFLISAIVLYLILR